MNMGEIFPYIIGYQTYNEQKMEHPIIQAIRNKNHEQLKIQLSITENINVIGTLFEPQDLTALDFAVHRGDEVSVELLLAHGAIPNYNQPLHIWNVSTLSRAINSHNIKVIQLLVNHGCDLDTILEIPLIRQQMPYVSCYNYWCQIVERKNLPMFQTLLEHTGRKIINDEWSQNLLLSAITAWSNEVIEYLLDHGVSIESSVNENNWTCVFYAVANNAYYAFKLLASRGANLKHRDAMGRNLLHIAAYYNTNGNEFAQLLIDHGLDVNATDNNGLTPINTVFATTRGLNQSTISIFLRQPNIDVTIPDKDGTTVLHCAVTWADKNVILNILCRPDVDINARNKDGMTPLQCISLDKTLNFRLLLELGAETENLFYRNERIENGVIFDILKLYQLKRKFANFSDDQTINTLLKNCTSTNVLQRYYELDYSMEIEQMKGTILCDNLTYYDFLHAKKRTCINIAKRPEMHDILIERKHRFDNYAYMLIKNYLKGVWTLSKIELEAINSAEDNLDVIFNYKLPNLVIYNIRKYIDIEDEVTLNNLKLLG